MFSIPRHFPGSPTSASVAASGQWLRSSRWCRRWRTPASGRPRRTRSSRRSRSEAGRGSSRWRHRRETRRSRAHRSERDGRRADRLRAAHRPAAKPGIGEALQPDPGAAAVVAAAQNLNGRAGDAPDHGARVDRWRGCSPRWRSCSPATPRRARRPGATSRRRPPSRRRRSRSPAYSVPGFRGSIARSSSSSLFLGVVDPSGVRRTDAGAPVVDAAKDTALLCRQVQGAGRRGRARWPRGRRPGPARRSPGGAASRVTRTPNEQAVSSCTLAHRPNRPRAVRIDGERPAPSSTPRQAVPPSVLRRMRSRSRRTASLSPPRGSRSLPPSAQSQGLPRRAGVARSGDATPWGRTGS